MQNVRGRVRQHADLSKINWFRVGGPAEYLFKPEDTDDLAEFLKHKPAATPVTVLGVGSNLIVRDGGIDGVVVRLGRGFAGIGIQDSGLRIQAGAAAMSVNVALAAQQAGIAGLEFLSGIPGTIGGALRMNGGAYGRETKDVLVEAQALDPEGNLHTLTPEELGYTYRHSTLPEDWIFTGAVLQGEPGDPKVIAERIEKISSERNLSQPVRSRTGGSTFKNPPGQKAWQLIDAAGLRGFKHGGAQVSEQHCNFLINTGDATAADLEELGEIIRQKVKETSGVELEWEIKRIGKTI